MLAYVKIGTLCKVHILPQASEITVMMLNIDEINSAHNLQIWNSISAPADTRLPLGSMEGTKG